MHVKQTQINQLGLLNLQIVMIGFLLVLSISFGVFWYAKSDDNPPRNSLQSIDAPPTATQTTQAGTDADETAANPSIPSGEYGIQKVNDVAQRSVNESAEEIGFTTGVIAKSSDGLSVDIVGGLPQVSTGNCDFVLTLNNFEVRETKPITDAEACEISLPVIEFPSAGTYTVAISYVSSDGQSFAVVDGLDINISPIPFAFTQGGGTQSGELITITVSGKNAYSGTCTYTFTLGATVLETSNTVTNSKACEINLPRSEFPEPGPWLLEVSFEGSNALVTGSGQGFVVPIN